MFICGFVIAANDQPNHAFENFILEFVEVKNWSLLVVTGESNENTGAFKIVVACRHNRVQSQRDCQSIRPGRYFSHIQKHDQWKQGVQGYLASIAFADAMVGMARWRRTGLNPTPHVRESFGWSLTNRKNRWGILLSVTRKRRPLSRSSRSKLNRVKHDWATRALRS